MLRSGQGPLGLIVKEHKITGDLQRIRCKALGPDEWFVPFVLPFPIPFLSAKLLSSINPKGAPFYGVDISPDGSVVALACGKAKEVALWLHKEGAFPRRFFLHHLLRFKGCIIKRPHRSHLLGCVHLQWLKVTFILRRQNHQILGHQPKCVPFPIFRFWKTHSFFLFFPSAFSHLLTLLEGGFVIWGFIIWGVQYLLPPPPPIDPPPN